MADYIIERISKDEPKPVYSDKYKSTTYYIKCRLQGHSRPVEIGKKKPDALREGMTVSGTIIDKPEFEVDGWKADPVAFGGGQQGTFASGAGSNPYSGSSKPVYQPRDDNAIRAQWAIGQAMTSQTQGHIDFVTVEMDAKRLYAMVERVKDSTDGGSTSDSLKVPTSQTTSKPWQVNTKKPDAKLWPSDHAEDDAEAVSLYQTFAGAEEVPPEEYDPSQIPF